MRGRDQKPSDAVAYGQAACGQHRIDMIAVKKFEPVVVESGGRELPFDLAVDLLHDAQRMARILSRVRIAGRIDLEPAAVDLAGKGLYFDPRKFGRSTASQCRPFRLDGTIVLVPGSLGKPLVSAETLLFLAFVVLRTLAAEVRVQFAQRAPDVIGDPTAIVIYAAVVEDRSPFFLFLFLHEAARRLPAAVRRPAGHPGSDP